MTISNDEHRTTPVRRDEAAAAPTPLGLVVGAIGLALAALLALLGTVMRSNADFAHANVTRQLAAQRIAFKPLDALTEQERRVPCLVENAGKALTTGKQAQCYADHFIGAHLKAVAGGRTFAEMRELQTSLRARVAEAQARNDPSVGELQRQLNEVNGQRQALFEGESNRGLLLTSYGFATLGTKADQAADAAFAAATVLLVASGVMLVRASRRRYDPSGRASQVGMRWRAARASSTRPTGDVRGAAWASSPESAAMRRRASARAASVWGLSVSVGSIISASSTISGK